MAAPSPIPSVSVGAQAEPEAQPLIFAGALPGAPQALAPKSSKATMSSSSILKFKAPASIQQVPRQAKPSPVAAAAAARLDEKPKIKSGDEASKSI